LNLNVERFFLGAGSEGHGTIADIREHENEEFAETPVQSQFPYLAGFWKSIADLPPL